MQWSVNDNVVQQNNAIHQMLKPCKLYSEIRFLKVFETFGPKVARYDKVIDWSGFFELVWYNERSNPLRNFHQNYELGSFCGHFNSISFYVERAFWP